MAKVEDQPRSTSCLMAERQEVLMCASKRPPRRGASSHTAAATQPPKSLSYEVRVLESWNPTIERAAARAARSLGGGPAQADDIAQAVRLGVQRTIRKFISLPDAYVHRVIANTVSRWLRDERTGCTVWSARTCELDEAAESASVVELDLADVEVAVKVSRWVGELPQRLQDLFAHVYVDGRTQRETAACMHVSQPRVAQLHEQLLQLARRDLAHLAS